MALRQRESFCAAPRLPFFSSLDGGFGRGFPRCMPIRQGGRKQAGTGRRYCRAHPDTFYFEDVYSTVAFSGKLLQSRDNGIANYDIAGGWMCKSPLYQKKLAAFGIDEAADALIEGKAYFIMSREEESLRGLSWIGVPYIENGVQVQAEEYDKINENYSVYQVIPFSESREYLRETK
jgi:hypothetical protein